MSQNKRQQPAKNKKGPSGGGGSIPRMPSWKSKAPQGKGYCSQIGQDFYVNHTYIKNHKNGIFVDVGAFDGVNLSNTHFFEKNLNWKGICIEPQETYFKMLQKNRTCTCMNYAAFNSKTTVNFRMSSENKMLGGIASHHNTKNRMKSNEISIIQVPTVTLKEVFQENDISIVDYISIDTEGSEFQVLQGIDWNNVHINIINFEHNFDKNMFQAIKKFLLLRNFVFDCFIAHDAFFRNKTINWSWDTSPSNFNNP